MIFTVPRVDTRTARILVVDDAETHRYAVRRILENAGYAVQEAGTGTEALRIAREGVDLVVLDVGLPDISGKEVCTALRESASTASIAVLLYSASFRGTSDRVRGLRVGADAYLVAPAEPEELLATVEALLRMRHAERRAQELGAQWQRTFDAITDGICLTDGHGRVQRCNHAMAILLGLPSVEEAVGRPFLDLVRPIVSDAADVPPATCAAREERDVRAGERWLRFVSDPIVLGDDQVIGCVQVVSDVTGRRAEQAALQAHAAELARSNRELETFAYVVSHDLREPLRTIGAYAQLLERRERPRLDGTALEFLDFMVQGVARMEALVRDLLDYSRVGTQPLRPSLVKADDALDMAIGNLDLAIAERGARIERGPLPEVRADIQQIARVFQNLLANGIKFTRERVPEISVTAAGTPDEWRFSITDNGQGIPPSQIDRIFGLFHRLHDGEVSGTGLGLAICKRIVERHGGRIWAESRAHGATFHFTLPRQGPGFPLR